VGVEAKRIRRPGNGSVPEVIGAAFDRRHPGEVLPLPSLAGGPLLGQVAGITVVIAGDPRPVDLDDAGGEAIQQQSVVRGHHHPVAVGHVDRVVEHQHIRAGEPAQQGRSVLADDADPFAGTDRELGGRKGNS
jgi:hypothetical protein